MNEPGHTNGVRCIWPEGQQREPQHKPEPEKRRGPPRKEACIRGHINPERNKSGACVQCSREIARKWSKEKRDAARRALKA